MKKALFVIAALLTAACSSSREQEPTVVYRGYDDAGCNCWPKTALFPKKRYFLATLRQTAKPPELTKSRLSEYVPAKKTPLFRRIRPSSQPLTLTFDFTNRHRLAKKIFPDKNTGKKQKILHPNTLICIKKYLFIAIRLKFY